MVNVVQQGWSRGYYNVWEDVDLTKTIGYKTALEGDYVVHNLTQQVRTDFKQDCLWGCDELYIIKDIYGGFLEFLKEQVI